MEDKSAVCFSAVHNDGVIIGKDEGDKHAKKDEVLHYAALGLGDTVPSAYEAGRPMARPPPVRTGASGELPLAPSVPRTPTSPQVGPSWPHSNLTSSSAWTPGTSRSPSSLSCWRGCAELFSRLKDLYYCDGDEEGEGAPRG